MYNSAGSLKMWENNADTPITASNLSKSINFQASSKFIYLTTEEDDYELWADVVITGDFPLESEISTEWANKMVYNSDTGVAKKAVYDNSGFQWQPIRTEDRFDTTNRLLKVKGGIQIAMSYVDKDTSARVYENFDFGSDDQVISFDDVLNEDFTLSNFNSYTVYNIYLMHNFSYGDNAYCKIISSADQTKTYWKEIADNPLSPTGNEVISYRKIGGFKTDSNGEIIEDSIWDLFTYREEVTVEKINKYEDGVVREINASDINIVNDQQIFNATDVEGAIQESRFLLNSIQEQFYTNKRIGANLKFSPFKIDTSGDLIQTAINELTLMISSGYIDVLGTQKVIDDNVFLNSSTLPISVNDATPVTGVTLGSGTNKLDAGIWRVYLDASNSITSGNITIKKDTVERPRFRPENYGWFDSLGNRCIGKFKVRDDNGFYIEKMSVTDTFDQNVPPNTIHIHHGTLVPDGLLLCDGKWHDVIGIDNNVYSTWSDLVAAVGMDWGDSWYEETPNLMDTFLKMPPLSYINMNTGQNFTLPTGGAESNGGSADCGRTGGANTHIHEFPHQHGTGNINIISSGAHPQQHSVAFSGTTDSVTVETVPSGSTVSVEEHTHNMIISGGNHNHPTESVQGNTERLEDADAETDSASSLPPYKEMLFCIKK